MATVVSDLERRTVINGDEQIAEPQLGLDTEDADGFLLHLIRTIALYLFVFLSQAAKVSATDAEHAVFVADAATPDLLSTQTKELQRRLHTALFAWMQSEVNSNQFDGLLQEQRAFVLIQRLFRQQRTKAAVQCRVLAALLTSYLTQLETPLVHCEPASMLSSTLEYLLASENKEAVPLPMLYPLVNAVDLVSIEQRECLDALMNLLRWLTAHDQSQKVFTTFTSKYHVKIIGMEASSNTLFNSQDSKKYNSEALSVCFVQMLLHYSDHIFRRDVQFEDMVPTLTYSDTEDDDISVEDGAATRSLPQLPEEPHDACPNELLKPASPTAIDTNWLENEQKNEKTVVSVLETTDVAFAMEKGQIRTKISSRTLRKRKKREEKVVSVGTKTTRRANKHRSKPIQEEETQYMDEKMQAWANEEPLPAAVCVGIAAAAGTIAAMLCAFFNLPTQ